MPILCWFFLIFLIFQHQAMRSCPPCAPGAFANATASTACLPCAAGTFAMREGSTACAACPDGAGSFPGNSACVMCV